MTPRQRLLAAMRQEDVDYLPCSIYFNPNLQVGGYDLRRWRDRARLALDLGTDPVLHLTVAAAGHPEVRTRTWREDVSGQPSPILFKEYCTPAGTLRMGVRRTPEWPHGDDIPWGDFSAGHIYEPLLKSPEDVAAFTYLWQPPTETDLENARSRTGPLRDFARRHRLPIQGFGGYGLATLVFVMGAQNAVLFAADYPEAFRHLAEIDSRANVERIRLCAAAGAHFIKRFGGYEQTNLFSPTIFRNIVAPLLRAEVAVAHDCGVPIYYRVVTGMGPVLEDIAGIGFDCIEGGEPRLSECSLERWRDTLAGRACSWTGVSTPVLLGGSDAQAVRDEVRHCADLFGKRGFILGVTNSIRNHFPWTNTLAMIDEWKRVR